eukprot:365981-Chlamydomonas_euryale.AAC.13
MPSRVQADVRLPMPERALQAEPTQGPAPAPGPGQVHAQAPWPQLAPVPASWPAAAAAAAAAMSAAAAGPPQRFPEPRPVSERALMPTSRQDSGAPPAQEPNMASEHVGDAHRTHACEAPSNFPVQFSLKSMCTSSHAPACTLACKVYASA